MAISTPGDIVMDVVRAADPAMAQTARARLSSLVGRGADAAFSAAVPHRAAGNQPAATPEAFVKFEAMVLQNFLQTMLPKDTESVYGGGLAGEMWQSMTAEKMSEALAERGGIGIADRILADHYYAGETKVSMQGVSYDPEKPERDRQDLLSTALVQELQRKMAQSLQETPAQSATDANR